MFSIVSKIWVHGFVNHYILFFILYSIPAVWELGLYIFSYKISYFIYPGVHMFVREHFQFAMADTDGSLLLFQHGKSHRHKSRSVKKSFSQLDELE